MYEQLNLPGGWIKQSIYLQLTARQADLGTWSLSSMKAEHQEDFLYSNTKIAELQNSNA